VLSGPAANMAGEVAFSAETVGGGVQIYVPEIGVVERIP
jgi:hypothetical protein